MRVKAGWSFPDTHMCETTFDFRLGGLEYKPGLESSVYPVDIWAFRMRVLFAITFLASSLVICNAFTIPDFFNWILDFDDQNEIDNSIQNWDLYGSQETQGQSRGYELFDNQGLSGYQHQHTEGHLQAEDEPSDVIDHILPAFLVAFCTTIINNLLLLKSATKTDTKGCNLFHYIKLMF